jgi:hypothetical protein
MYVYWRLTNPVKVNIFVSTRRLSSVIISIVRSPFNW